jgi:cytochrome P450
MPEAVYREPIVQYGAGITAVTDPALIKRILLDEPDWFPKAPIERATLGPLLGNGILIASGSVWRWQRQVAAPLFRHVEVLRYVPIVAKAAAEIVRTWQKSSPGSLHRIDEDMSHATFEVIAGTMLDGGDPAVTAAIERANRDYLLPISWPLAYGILGMPQWLPYPRRHLRKNAERNMRQQVHRLVARRRDGTGDRENLLSRLLKAKDPDTAAGLSDEQMVDNLLTFLLAGHETTAKALSWALYMVARLPDWEDRLVREIDGIVGDGPLTEHNVNRLSDVTLFLKETMRFYPPISSIIRVAAKDVELGGVRVRKGGLIIIPIYAIHRHRRLWDDPDRFDPERFTPEREAAQARYQYMPFGAGPRICIGASFSMLEAVTMLACFVRAARFEIPPGYEPVPLSRITLQPKGGLALKVWPRR